MQFHELDRDPETGERPVLAALAWLETLIKSPDVRWAADQHAEAQHVLANAKVTLLTTLTVVQKPGGAFALEATKIRANPVEPAVAQPDNRPRLVSIHGKILGGQ